MLKAVLFDLDDTFYEEILERIGVAGDEVLMVGDDWGNDIAPASSVGCYTYWLPMNGETAPPAAAVVTSYGTLDDLYDLVSSGWLSGLAA